MKTCWDLAFSNINTDNVQEKKKRNKNKIKAEQVTSVSDINHNTYKGNNIYIYINIYTPISLRIYIKYIYIYYISACNI